MLKGVHIGKHDNYISKDLMDKQRMVCTELKLSITDDSMMNNIVCIGEGKANLLRLVEIGLSFYES